MDGFSELDQKFAICIQTDSQSLLTLRKVYLEVPDASAAKSDYIRVIDDEGEDYLYPASYFVRVALPTEVEAALLKAA